VDLWLWPLVGLAGVAAAAIVANRGGDLASTIVSIAILVITATTLRYIVPKRAELYVEREFRPSTDDLIFFVYPQPAVAGQQQVPRDFLLQLNVTVINVGGRKAVLSSLALTEFEDAGGQLIRLGELPMPVQGHLVIAQRSWTLQGLAQNIQEVPPPFTLEPDDAITLRFRVRHGIDWSARWDLNTLRGLAAQLARPISIGKVVATFRRGSELVQREFLIDLGVEQQQLYVQLLSTLTNGFTRMQNIPPRPIPL
jgi:hypothetical protein